MNLALMDYPQTGEQIVLSAYHLDEDKNYHCRRFTREQLWHAAHQAATLLQQNGLKAGQYQLHCFSGNRAEDLIFRCAAVLLGTIPVTVNWQADELEQVLYKQALSEAAIAIVDEAFPLEIKHALTKKTNVRSAESLWDISPEPLTEVTLTADDAKLVIFTSGTTGHPKGVLHQYSSYQTNKATFDSFLKIGSDHRFATVIVNPLHHANATAISDWALRSHMGEIHLFERYSSAFWEQLVFIDSHDYDRIVVPLTARHFDFLESLKLQQHFRDLEKVIKAMSRCDFLIGSAPVGPTTVTRLLTYSGKHPRVRFGSTETCLQVMGIPYHFSDQQTQDAFEAGWHFKDGEQPGYFIGREHPGYTEVSLVLSLDRNSPDYMKSCPEGTPGYVVTRGNNTMSHYLKKPEATASVFSEQWYTGLLDVGFWLKDAHDGQANYYWMSRESALLIRGGANYSCDQINEILCQHLKDTLSLEDHDFDLAVVGLKINSEHEDSCCATVTLFQETLDPAAVITALKNVNSKAAKPDQIRFATIPRNFKGAILLPELKRAYEQWLAN